MRRGQSRRSISRPSTLESQSGADRGRPGVQVESIVFKQCERQPLHAKTDAGGVRRFALASSIPHIDAKWS